MWENQKKDKPVPQDARAIDAGQKSVNSPESAPFVVTAMWVLAGLFLSNQGGCRMTTPADMTIGRDNQLAEYHWNCGLNVAYITVRLFHADVDIYKLADEIKAGVRLERSVSLLDLKRAFEKHGLIAEGFRADYSEEIIPFAEPDNILIVRVESRFRDQTIGHFIVIKGSQDYVVVIDPASHPKRLAKENIIEEGVLSSASGEFLVVRNK